MLVDDIADRIAIACPAEIDAIIKDMWADHAHGLLTDNEMETLDEAARTRREAIQTRRTETRPTPSSAPRGSARSLRSIRSRTRRRAISDRALPFIGRAERRSARFLRIFPGKFYSARRTGLLTGFSRSHIAAPGPFSPRRRDHVTHDDTKRASSSRTPARALRRSPCAAARAAADKATADLVALAQRLAEIVEAEVAPESPQRSRLGRAWGWFLRN